jgi:hypothetical protein
MASGKRTRKPKAHDVGGFPKTRRRRTFGGQVWTCEPGAFQLSFGQNFPDQLQLSRATRWQRDECSNPTVGHSSRSDRQRLLLRAWITGALVRSRSATRTRPLYSRGDLVILFLSLGLGGARPGDCSLRLGRLLFDGRLVVFPATGQPQEAKAQQSKAQSTGEQPHDEYDSPQKWARRRLKWRKRDQENITRCCATLM